MKYITSSRVFLTLSAVVLLIAVLMFDSERHTGERLTLVPIFAFVLWLAYTAGEMSTTNTLDDEFVSSYLNSDHDVGYEGAHPGDSVVWPHHEEATQVQAVINKHPFATTTD